MAIKGYAHIDSSTGKLLASQLPDNPTFSGVSLSNGTSLSHGIVNVTTGINALSMGSTNLLIVPADVALIVTKFVFVLAAVDSISGTLSLGCGTDVVAENIMPSQALTGFNTAGAMWVHNVSGSRVLASSTEVLKLGVDAEFTGTTATLIAITFGAYVPT